MKCDEVKREMALKVGQDAVDRLRWREVRRHAAECVACRMHYKQLKVSMALLEQAYPDETYEVQGSLWPAVESQLDAPRKKPRLLSTWVPVMSTIAAGLLLMFVLTPQPQPAHGRHINRDLSRQILPSLSDWTAGNEPIEQEQQNKKTAHRPDKM